MRKTLAFLTISLLFSFPVEGADARREIKKIISSIEKKYSIELEYEHIPQSEDTTAIYQEATYNDYAKLLKYLKLFEEEINKYPITFFRKSNLNTIYFVKKFFYSEHPTEGFYSPSYRLIFLDFSRRFNKYRMAHNIHHEIFHLLEHQGRMTKNERERWDRLNENGFVYGQTYAPSLFSKNQSPYRGFVTRYSLSKPKEDRAEVFASLMIPSQNRLIHRWIDSDDILKDKVSFIKLLAERFCLEMDNNYWIKFQQ